MTWLPRTRLHSRRFADTAISCCKRVRHPRKRKMFLHVDKSAERCRTRLDGEQSARILAQIMRNILLRVFHTQTMHNLCRQRLQRCFLLLSIVVEERGLYSKKLKLDLQLYSLGVTISTRARTFSRLRAFTGKFVVQLFVNIRSDRRPFIPLLIDAHLCRWREKRCVGRLTNSFDPSFD